MVSRQGPLVSGGGGGRAVHGGEAVNESPH